MSLKVFDSFLFPIEVPLYLFPPFLYYYCHYYIYTYSLFAVYMDM